MTDQRTQGIAFESLAQAVDFIATCVETGRATGLFAQLAHQRHGGGRSDVSRFESRIFPKLRDKHLELDLRSLYVGRAFPAAGDSFKLGGHDAELGYIHIDFVRDAGSWFLDDIWECR